MKTLGCCSVIVLDGTPAKPYNLKGKAYACRGGGTGRRARLRGVWYNTMGVQVPLPTPLEMQRGEKSPRFTFSSI